MTSQPLEYGPQPRTHPHRVIQRLLAVLALLAVCVWTVRVALQRLYYLDRNSVESELRSVPGGRVLQIGGFDDGLSWTVATAEVSVDGSTARTISFRSPRHGELQSGSRMCVTSIGPYQVDVEVSDERMLVQHLDFGRDSEFKDVLPFRLRDLHDLAARYDEVLAFVTNEPSGTYTAPDGKVCTYQIRASQGSQPQPWRLR
jgi:hypothetical protein